MKGYSNIPQLYQASLDLPMFEASGAVARDISRQAALDKTSTLHGATIAWAHIAPSNVSVVAFTSGTPDYVDISAANSTDLNYQAGAFSGVAWVYASLLVANLRHIFNKGGTVDGWKFHVAGGNGAIYFTTCQAGPTVQETLSDIGQVVLNTWYMLGFSRLGAAVKLFKNGVDVTLTPGAHVNPDSAAARLLNIGCDITHAGPWDGYIWRPRIFSRQLSATELKELFDMERGLFGV